MPYPSYNPMQQYPGFIPNMQPQPQYQMPQYQIPQQNQFNSKIVDSIDIVKVTDIPMDGNTYFFPKADGTEVYSKRWLSNGSTEINTYAKVDINQIEDTKNKFEETLMDKLNSIDERIEKLEKNLSKPATRSKEA